MYNKNKTDFKKYLHKTLILFSGVLYLRLQNMVFRQELSFHPNFNLRSSGNHRQTNKQVSPQGKMKTV